MTMENSRKHIPYFDVCVKCDSYFAKDIKTIDVCGLCFERISMDLWGIGVPTE